MKDARPWFRSNKERASEKGEISGSRVIMGRKGGERKRDCRIGGSSGGARITRDLIEYRIQLVTHSNLGVCGGREWGLGCHSSTGGAAFWPLLILFSFMKDHGCFCNLQGLRVLVQWLRLTYVLKTGRFGGTVHYGDTLSVWRTRHHHILQIYYFHQRIHIKNAE